MGVEVVSEIEGIEMKVKEKKFKKGLDRLELWPLQERGVMMMSGEEGEIGYETGEGKVSVRLVERIKVRLKEVREFEKDIKEEKYGMRVGDRIGKEEALVVFMLPWDKEEGRELEMLVYVNREHFMKSLEGEKLGKGF